MTDLEWTGERLVTSLDLLHGVIEHLHRYAVAKQIVGDKIVLDIASGEGYGSFLLSKNAKKVFGVDINQESIEHAKTKYKNADNLEYLCGSTSKIPLPDNSVDVVVSFETIEHHNEHDLMMLEILRVLKEDGCLLLSSPERDIYRQREPHNPFHIKELSLDELRSLVKKYFKYDHFFSQKFIIGSLIHSFSSDMLSGFKMFDGNYTTIYEGLNEDDFYNKDCFNLVICSNADLTKYKLPGASLFNGVDVIKKEMNDLKDQIQNAKNEKQKVLNSKSYKLGNWLVRKFTFRK
ncbi:MAG TPA: class I SAM-dependent methyltransferase [Hanamia sp.]